MNYTIHQLRIFIKVYEYQSITKAAEALYLTQPAVSIQLKKLQEEFEIPLIEVIGRKLYITSFGEEVYILANKILSIVEQIEVSKDSYKGVITGTIKIAAASTGKYVMPYFLTGFTKKYPQVRLSIDVTNKTKVVESLQENTVDFALISVIPPTLSLECLPLIKNEWHLVAATDYPNLGTRMMAKKLNQHVLIFREEGSATRAAMKNFLVKNQITVNRSMELVSNEAVKQAVRAGLGLSIMPVIGIRSELELQKMRIVPMKGLPIVTNWNLCHSSGKQLSPAATALLDYIKEHKTAISERYFK